MRLQKWVKMKQPKPPEAFDPLLMFQPDNYFPSQEFGYPLREKKKIKIFPCEEPLKENTLEKGQ